MIRKKVIQVVNIRYSKTSLEVFEEEKLFIQKFSQS
jgi:hypothetical protein